MPDVPLTPPRVEFLDPRTGKVSREWYRFFLSLFSSTGRIDDGEVAPFQAAYTEQASEFGKLLSEIEISLPLSRTEIVDKPRRVVALDNTDSPYDVLIEDANLTIDATTGAVSVNLPTAAGIPGRELVFSCIDATNTITLVPFGVETIGGAATFNFLAQGEALSFYSDGTNWQVM